MIRPAVEEQQRSHRAFGVADVAGVSAIKAHLGRRRGAPDLRTTQDHLTVIGPVPMTAYFSPRVRATLSSIRFSFPSASQGNVAVVGPVSTAATSHCIAGRFTEIARPEGSDVNAIERNLAETFIQSLLQDPRTLGLKGRRDPRVHPSSSRDSAVLTLFLPASSRGVLAVVGIVSAKALFRCFQRANDENGVDP